MQILIQIQYANNKVDPIDGYPSKTNRDQNVA